MSKPFSVGASRVDISPPLGTHLAGDGWGRHRPTREILDPLYATAMVFDAGGQRVCVIALDLTAVAEPLSRQVREAVAKSLGIQPDAVLVCATQTHSAPSLGGFMLSADFPLEDEAGTQYLRGANAYIDLVVPKAIQAGVEAGRNLKPAEVGCGRGMLGDFAFNRRGVHRDHPATIEMPFKLFADNRRPLGPTNVAYLEGPMDPEVGVLSIRAGGQIQSLLLHHTCHPVILFGQDYAEPNRWHSASSDWCGAWCEQMLSRTSADCVPMVLNGACGNINPWHPFDPNFEPDHRRMGRALADMTEKIVREMDYATEGVVDHTSRTVALPYRDIPPQRAAEVERILSEHPQPPQRQDGAGVDPAWFRAASTRSVELDKKRSPTFDYEIQVFRVGDLAIVGWPGEPFVEGQLAVKTLSPAGFVQVAHMASHNAGYLGTRQAYERDGHETNFDVTYWAKLAPGTLETVVRTTRELVEQLF